MLSRRSALAAAVLASGLFLAAAESQAEVVANVTDAKGDVMVGQGKVARIGTTTRMKNGAINNNDQVTVGADGSATITFLDGSTVKAGAGTKLSINEMASKDMNMAMSKGTTRTIKVASGDVYGDIKPNTKVFTQFDTPSGVAAVRGTTLEIKITPGGVAQIKVDGGQVIVIPASQLSGGALVTLSTGQTIKVTASPSATTASIEVVSDGGKPITTTVGNQEVKMTTGTAVTLAPQPAAAGATTADVKIEVTSGSATVTNTTTNAVSTVQTGGTVTATGGATVTPGGGPEPGPVVITVEVESRPVVTDTSDVSGQAGSGG